MTSMRMRKTRVGIISASFAPRLEPTRAKRTQNSACRQGMNPLRA